MTVLADLVNQMLNVPMLSLWASLPNTKDLPFLALTSSICFGVVLIFFSKFIIQKVYYFIDLKKSWQIKWKIKCLKSCERDLMNMIKYCNCNPIMLRLAWSDAGTYDKNITTWPVCGGCNGSIRLENEYQQAVNKGLEKAISLLLPIKIKYPSISWADLIQMAGANAVKLSGGPDIRIRYGRVDIPKNYFTSEKANLNFCVSQSKKLPCNFFPYPDGSHTPEFHIRNVFFRLGFSCREIVALCGAHTIGRGFRDRTGVCPFSSGDRGATQYTRLTSLAKGNGEPGIGMAGGMSWTENWLQFDNSYFKRPYSQAQQHSQQRKIKSRMGSTSSTTSTGTNGHGSQSGHNSSHHHGHSHHNSSSSRARGHSQSSSGSAESRTTIFPGFGVGKEVEKGFLSDGEYKTEKPDKADQADKADNAEKIEKIEKENEEKGNVSTRGGYRGNGTGSGSNVVETPVVTPAMTPIGTPLMTPLATPRGERGDKGEGGERGEKFENSSVDSSFTSHSGVDRNTERNRRKVPHLSHSTSSSVVANNELLWLPTDDALFKSPEFKFYFEQYAVDQKLFFSDYSLVHRKMSELGAKFDPPEGIEL